MFVPRPIPPLEIGGRPLTLDAVKDALYHCSPCGRATLTAHLQRFDYRVDDRELIRLLSLVEGLEGFEHDLPGVRKPIELLCLRGQRV